MESVNSKSGSCGSLVAHYNVKQIGANNNYVEMVICHYDCHAECLKLVTRYSTPLHRSTRDFSLSLRKLFGSAPAAASVKENCLLVCFIPILYTLIRELIKCRLSEHLSFVQSQNSVFKQFIDTGKIS